MIPALIFMMFSQAGAESVPEFCAAIAEPKIEKRIPLPGNVNFFMRGASTGEAGFATSNGNRVLNLNTEVMSEIPGSIDPVPTPDGQLIAVPMNIIYNGTTGKYEQMSGATSPVYTLRDGIVYKLQSTRDSAGNLTIDMKKTKMTEAQLKKKRLSFQTPAMHFFGRGKDKDGKPPLLLADREVSRNYQSFGITSARQGQSNYRMLYEGDGILYFKEYGFNSSSGKVESSGKPREVCKGMKYISLPMLSRDGKEFTAYDVMKERTMVVRIGEKGSDCEITHTIPTLVGKADFSPDGEKLAFHIDRASASWVFANPDSKNDLSVMILDRKTGAMTGLPTPANEDAYYPVFLDDERIAYISSRKDDVKPKFSIVIIRLDSVPNLSCKDCSEGTRNAQIAAVLGRLYNTKCKKGEQTFRSAIAAYSRLNSAQCKTMVTQAEEKDLSRISEKSYAGEKSWSGEILSTLTRKDLEAMCGQSGSAAPAQASPETAY